MLTSTMFSEQPSNVFNTVKSREWIACISPTKCDLGLKTSVFYDLALGFESLFRLVVASRLKSRWCCLDDEPVIVCSVSPL